MKIDIIDPVQHTTIVIILVLAAVFVTLKKSVNFQLTSEHTNELKGLAILMVLFGHIGYFLSSDPRFLWPLSVDSGVGVNIFLFLSGFGLTASLVKQNTGRVGFYRKRFSGIYPVLWLVLAVFFLLDLVVLNRSYSLTYVVRSLVGFFPSGDLYDDINSPLWYITPLIFYYVSYPLVFIKKYLWLSAVILGLTGYLLTKLPLPVTVDVLKLYQTHYLAFPLGVFFYSILQSPLPHVVKAHLPRLVRYLIIVILSITAGYFSIHSNVGQGVNKEQITSLLTVVLFVLLFVLKGLSSRFLILMGTFSYEAYLIHWPLMSRYEVLYKTFPPFLATILYVGILLLLGWGLKKFSGLFH